LNRELRHFGVRLYEYQIRFLNDLPNASWFVRQAVEEKIQCVLHNRMFGRQGHGLISPAAMTLSLIDSAHEGGGFSSADSDVSMVTSTGPSGPSALTDVGGYSPQIGRQPSQTENTKQNGGQ
jgi:hypothetical protein